MEWLSLALGIISLVGSLVSTGFQMSKEDETFEYNKDLNQKVMDREDNAWQRAVADRSKAGLSVSGLSQGAGSGGTVSQLQAPQGAGNLSNILQNVSSTSFGLADSAYNRKLQKQIATDELELKRDQLKNDKMISGVEATLHKLQVMKELRLAEDQLTTSASVEEREKKIFNHNIDIAKRLGLPYGDSPDWEAVLLGKGTEILSNSMDSIKQALTDAPSKIAESVGEKMESILDMSNITEPIKEKASEVLDAVNDKISDSKAKIKYNLDKVKEKIESSKHGSGHGF